MSPSELREWTVSHQRYNPTRERWEISMLEVYQAHADEEALLRAGWRPDAQQDLLVWDRGF